MDQQRKLDWRSIPILIAGILLQYVVFAKHIEIPEEISGYLHWETVRVDVFVYYRGLSIIIMALVMMAIALYDISKREDIRQKWIHHLKKPMNLALIGVSVLVTISQITSEYFDSSLLGAYITGEGSLHWIAYILIFLYTSFYINKSSFNALGKGLFVSSVLIFVIGSLSNLGYSIFESSWYLNLIKPPSMGSISYTDSMASQFTTFFGNPNHVGSFVAIVLPFFVIMNFDWNRKDIYYWLPAWTVFVILVFSRSSAGLLGSAVALGIWFTYLLISKSFKFKRHGVLALGFIVLYLGCSLIAGAGSISDEIAGLTSLTAHRAESSKLSDIRATSETVTFDYFDYEVSIVRKGTEIEFQLNGIAQDLQPDVIDDRDGYRVANQELQDISFFLVEPSLMEIHLGKHVFFIVNTPDALVLTTTRLEPVYLDEIPTLGFKGYERFASTRGYIWSRGLPLLKDTVLIGKGADTFAMNFPQYDVVGKINAFNRYNHTVDKPHNMYLMIAYSYGWLALGLFLFAVGYTVFYLWKTYGLKVGFAVLAMLSGIMTTWVFNDSMVLYVFVFWVVFGAVSSGVVFEEEKA